MVSPSESSRNPSPYPPNIQPMTHTQPYAYPQEQLTAPFNQYSNQSIAPHPAFEDRPTPPSAHFSAPVPQQASMDHSLIHPQNPYPEQHRLARLAHQHHTPDPMTAMAHQYDRVDPLQSNRASDPQAAVFSRTMRTLSPVSTAVSTYSTPSPVPDPSLQNRFSFMSPYYHPHQPSQAGAYAQNEPLPSQSSSSDIPQQQSGYHLSQQQQQYPPVPPDTYGISYRLAATTMTEGQASSRSAYDTRSRNPTEVSSIPMSNSSSWSQSSLSNALEPRPRSRDPGPSREMSDSPMHSVSESEPGSGMNTPLPAGVLSSQGSSLSSQHSALVSGSSLHHASHQPRKKKKSKMHTCDICGKQFPR